MDREYLLKEIIQNDRSIREIAIENKKHPDTIRYWAAKHGIKIPNQRRHGGRVAHNRKDLTGKRFGRLEVLCISETKTKSYKKSIHYTCRCDCGNLTCVPTPLLTRLRTKSCGCLKHESYHWGGHGEISATYWRSVTQNALVRGMQLDVSVEYVWNLFLKQERKCALSGLELYFVSHYRSPGKAKQTASLDRIDSKKGYEIGNVQWVHKDINKAKQSKTDQEFIEMCLAVARHYNRSKRKTKDGKQRRICY